jgi:predicted MFS family arabinose efflux permease
MRAMTDEEPMRDKDAIEGMAEEILLGHPVPSGLMPWYLLKNRSFRWLLIGESISAIAFWGLLAAEFSDAAFRFDATPSQQFILWAAFSLPFVLMTPFQSLLVDRWSPKWMNLIGYAMFLLAIPPAILGNSIEALYLSMFFIGLADASIQPARSALTGLLISEQDLVKGNGMLSAGLQIAGVLGPLLGAIMIGRTGETTGVYLLAAAAALLCLPFFVMIRDLRQSGDRPSMTLRDLADGAVTASRQPQLRMLMFLSIAMFMAISIFFSLEPLLVRHTMHAGKDAVSYLWSAQAFGALIGALLLTRTREGKGKELGFIGLALSTAGAGALIYAGFAQFGAALIGSAIMGLGFSRFFAPSLALIQRVAGEDKRGRVTSVFSVLQESIGLLASVFLASVALSQSSVQPMLIGAAVFLIVAGVLALTALRRGAADGPPA